MGWAMGIARMTARCRNGRRTSIRRGRRSVWPLGLRGPRTERVSVMTNQRRVAALVLTVLTSAFLAGCTDDPARTNSPSATTSPEGEPSSSAPTSETSTPLSEVAGQAAAEAIHEYFAVVDELRQDPSVPLSRLKSVALGGQLTAQEVFTRNQRKAGNKQVGDTTLPDVVVQQIVTDTSTQDGALAQVDVCWDVSAVDVLDREGDSIVTPDRSERGWTRYTLSNPRGEAPFDKGWRVSNGEDLEKAPCSAA